MYTRVDRAEIWQAKQRVCFTRVDRVEIWQATQRECITRRVH